MKILNLLGKGLNRSVSLPKLNLRAYNMAQVSRMTADWMTSMSSADSELRNAIKILRERGRVLERDNDYARRYLQLLESNILGAQGVTLSMNQLLDGRGKPDFDARKKIVAGWERFSKKENFTVTRSVSRLEAEQLIVRRVACDGEIFIRKVFGFDNEFKFSLQLLEGDICDHWYNETLPNGNKVRMGIEMNKWDEPTAYYFYNRHPGDWLPDVYQYDGKRIRVPANEVIHVFVRERIPQSRGATWLCSAGLRLKMLDGYEEAEVAAARASACKMGFMQKEYPEGYQGEEDVEGNVTMEAEPAMIEELPIGVTFKEWNPTHPNGNYGNFIKSALRGVAAGLGIGYNTLANDLERTNYSSMRAGNLEEREFYMKVQKFLGWILYEPLFEDVLKMGMLAGIIELPFAKFEQFNNPTFKFRRWSWVDPEKDVAASTKAIDYNLQSPQSVISDRGGDADDTLQEIKEFREKAAMMGIVDVEQATGEAKAYQTAVTAGMITPCLEDEVAFREKYGWPVMPPAVKKAWAEVGGFRIPGPVNSPVPEEPVPAASVPTSGKRPEEGEEEPTDE
jgi:lambda family phage portal protein